MEVVPNYGTGYSANNPTFCDTQYTACAVSGASPLQRVFLFNLNIKNFVTQNRKDLKMLLWFQILLISPGDREDSFYKVIIYYIIYNSFAEPDEFISDTG